MRTIGECGRLEKQPLGGLASGHLKAIAIKTPPQAPDDTKMLN
jgi:hypothetical protein